jgi:hypothetical protein
MGTGVNYSCPTSIRKEIQSMATIIENWQQHLLTEAERINSRKDLSKDEKTARIHSDRAQMVRNATVTLSDYKSRLANERDKLDTLISQRHIKPVYPATEVGQLMRMNDFMQASQFKAELRGLSERSFIRLFKKKWNEEDLFSVNLILTIAEDTLSPASYGRFKELYNKLSAKGFSRDEKTAVTNIRSCENEIEALEKFLAKENENED